MECNNCGWFNPAGLTRCQKCNQPLRVQDVAKEDLVAFNCAKCGYPLSAGGQKCPNCGNLNAERETVIPNVKVQNGGCAATEVLDNNSPLLNNNQINSKNPKATVVLDNPESMIAPVKQSNLKATVVINNDSNPSPVAEHTNKAKSTVILDNPESFVAPVQTPANPKATVIINSSASKDTGIYQQQNSRLKQTVKDVNAFNNVASEQKVPVDTSSNLNEYLLVCMDSTDSTPLSIKLIPNNSIGLKKDDILLIAGLRYRVK